MSVNNIEEFIMSSEPGVKKIKDNPKSDVSPKIAKPNPKPIAKEIEPKETKIATKAIRNECLQSLEVYFVNENGQSDTYWLKPKEIMRLPASALTSQVSLLQQRRLVRIFDV